MPPIGSGSAALAGEAAAPRRRIVLYNPISGQGHLDAYARLYGRALAEAGHEVLLVAPTDAGAADYLARTSPEALARFRFVSFAEADATGTEREAAMRHASSRPRTGLVRRALAVAGWDGLRGLLGGVRRIAARHLPAPLRASIRRRVAPDAGLLSFREAKERIGSAAARVGWRPDLAVLLYLDMMRESAADVDAIGATDAPGWTGILFHPRLLAEPPRPPEAFLRSRTLRGLIFLVPDATQAYEAHAPHLRCLLAPDVADLEIGPEPTALAREIRARARGRTVVLLIGAITPHKGVETLLDVISASDPSRFFFAIVGAVHWSHFGSAEARLRAFREAPPENALFHEGYVEDERAYNDVLRASDILYAVYRPFRGSSNSLTKAAGLRLPILVDEASLMGQRVRAAEIGVTVPRDDVGAILSALDRLAILPQSAFRFEAFAADHSLEALSAALDERIADWVEGPRRVRSG